MTRYDVLTEPLFDVRLPDEGQDTYTLPQILHALWTRDITSFEGLRAHQRQAWHCVLAQLGALCFERGGLSEDPAHPEAWRDALLTLSDGVREAYCLVVEDVSKPALFQTPLPEGSLKSAKYKDPYLSPDELDMLVTSKNHDVKQSKIQDADAQHWIFALVTLQTMEGFMGRGNYGIVRMNGGFGSRPLVGYTAKMGWGARFVRDVDVLRDARARLLKSAPGYSRSGSALLWMLPWDGGKESGLELKECDPFFIEICRRLRMVQEHGELACWRANTGAYRIAAPKDLNGRTRDVWTPTGVEKALTLSGNGFDYKMMQEIMLGQTYQHPESMLVGLRAAGGMHFVAECLVRGQGKTEGLHHRALFVPKHISGSLGIPGERQRLAKLSRERVESADTGRLKVLYPALYRLIAAGREMSVDSDKLSKWRKGFEEQVDACFFPMLWSDFELPEGEARLRWASEIMRIARAQLEDAITSVPLPTSSRLRAVAVAESTFNARCSGFLADHARDDTPEEPPRRPPALDDKGQASLL